MQLNDDQFLRIRPYVNGKGIEINVVDRSKKRITQRSYFYPFVTVHCSAPERMITLITTMAPALHTDVNQAVRGIYATGS